MTYALTVNIQVFPSSSAMSPMGVPLNLQFTAPELSADAFGVHVLYLDAHLGIRAVKIAGAGVPPDVIQYHKSEELPDNSGQSKLFITNGLLTSARTITVDFDYVLGNAAIEAAPIEQRYTPMTVVLANRPYYGGGGIHTGVSGLITTKQSFYDLL